MEKRLNYIINISFYLYFIILIVERSISVILTFVNGINIFSNAFYGYTYMLVFLSIIGWLIYLIINCRLSIKGLFKSAEEYDFKNLCIASGILLLSGMVHTEYTIPVIQFISYGILIIGILLKVILNAKANENKAMLWLSFVYLVCFSMAIPVMYQSFIDLHILFHVLEAIASFTLVIVFTYLMILLFNNENNLFKVLPAILVVILDTPLIILRWQEEINWFVLIFLSLTTIMFLVGVIFNFVKNKQKAQ